MEESMTQRTVGDPQPGAPAPATDTPLPDDPDRPRWDIPAHAEPPQQITETPGDLGVAQREVWGIASRLHAVLEVARSIVWAAEHGYGLPDPRGGEVTPHLGWFGSAVEVRR
jgi:hypothetical protein